MKKSIQILFLFMLGISFYTHATTYYLSTSGSNSNSGTSSSSAFKTLEYAVTKLSAGDALTIASGTYNESSTIIIQSNGSSSKPITINGNSSSRPTFHFNGSESDSNRGIVMDGDYWKWNNIVIENAGDNGMLLSGNNNTLNNCVFRKNHDTGLQLSRYSSSASSISQWPSNNTISYCEAYDNCDSANEDADGFAAKLTCGEGNVFDHCVSHHNIDDGWDLYTKSNTGPIGVVKFYDCIAHSNGTLSDGSVSGSGDKNGYKLGSSSNTVNHILVRCVAFNNGHHGFTDNGNIGSIKFINLTSYNNAEYNYHTRDGASHQFVNCISYKGQDRIVGSASTSHNALIDSDFDFDYTVSSSDFVSLSPGSNSSPCSGNFLKLSSSSNLIDAGTTSSYLSNYSGSAPDLGAFEYGSSDPDPDPDPDPTPDGSISLSASAGDGSVNLSWSVSNISMNAMEVYRDTDSDPSGRTKLGAVSTTTTSYTDTDVTNGTTYYYWIKVYDTDGVITNSNAASATPTSGGTTEPSGDGDIIEDDDSRLISFDGSLKSYSNANNGYAINLSNDPGKQITWNYSASSSGTYTVTLRYTRKSSMSPLAYIYINGTKVKTLTLDETSSGEFVSSSFTATLSSGTNTIVLETAEDGEFADIDYIQISSGTKSAQLDQMNKEVNVLTLEQNYPNPVIDETSITFTTSSDTHVQLIISDMNGKIISKINNNVTAGSHVISINADEINLTPGIYIYSLITKEGSISKRMVKK